MVDDAIGPMLLALVCMAIGLLQFRVTAIVAVSLIVASIGAAASLLMGVPFATAAVRTLVGLCAVQGGYVVGLAVAFGCARKLGD